MNASVPRRWLRWLGPLAALGWVTGAIGLDRWGSARDHVDDRRDAIVVLGCRVEPDGTPSAPLRARAERAADLFHAGVAPRVVTTGGVGASGESEADVAAAVLVERGVPSAAIVRETSSTSTQQNADNAAALLGPARVVIVSDGYHLLRASRVFARRFDDVAAVAADALDPTARSFGAMREVVALVVYGLRGRL